MGLCVCMSEHTIVFLIWDCVCTVCEHTIVFFIWDCVCVRA